MISSKFTLNIVTNMLQSNGYNYITSYNVTSISINGASYAIKNKPNLKYGDFRATLWGYK